MMLIKLDGGVQINYEVYGTGKRLLLLHGWGLDLRTFDKIVPSLSQNYQVIVLDLPGFGHSVPLPKPFDITDYAETIENFLETLEVSETYVLGHSFGGAVSLYLASSSKRVSKLILEDSAGLYPKKVLVHLRIFLYKLLKKTLPSGYLELVKNALGSVDFKNSGPLRKTLIKVVNSNVLDLLPKIKIPTLVVWGQDDEFTTIEEAKILEKGIEKSKTIFLPRCGHFPHIERSEEFTRIVINFLGKS